MGEPTKEELMARIAELEKQAGAKRGNRIEFKGQRLRLGSLPRDALLRAMGSPLRFCRRAPLISPRKQEPA